MPKAITMFESEDGQRFESLAACEEYESANHEIYLRKLCDEIGYREIPLFKEHKYGCRSCTPVTVLTAMPRNMHELNMIAEMMRKEISSSITQMPGFTRDPKTNALTYSRAASFPMVYSVMVERFKKRKYPEVRLLTGYEIGRLANLATGPVTMIVPPDAHPNITHQVASYTNRRKQIMIECNGESKTISEWGKAYNIDPAIIRSRLYNGWNPEKAITTPKLGHRVRASRV